MADVALGTAWIDVKLRPMNIDKDAEKAANRAGKKIENFFDKYSKESFFDKYSRRAQENKLAVFLPSDQALATATANKVAVMSKTLHNKAGMIGAQLTYGLQDFLTGMSMGNVNQALLGMSNNLSMIAMQFGAMGGMITSVAVSALPLIYTGLRALITNEKDAKEAVDALTAAFERQKFAMEINAIRREALTDKEIDQMHGAAALQNRVEGEEKAIKNLDLAMIEHDKTKVEAEAIIGGRGKGSFGIGIADADVKKYKDLVDDLAKKQMQNPGARFLATEGEIQRQVDKIAKRFNVRVGKGVGEFIAKTTPEGMEFFKNPKPEETEAAKKQLAEANAAKDKAAEEKKKHELNLGKLQKRRDDEARHELDVQQRRMEAGFNKYEQGLIDLDEEERNKEIKIREDFSDTILEPKKTEAERKQEIENQFNEEMTDAARLRKMFSEKQGKIGRHISRSQAEGVALMEKKATEKRFNALWDLAERGTNPDVSAADKMSEANKDEFRRKRIALAEQYAGGKVGFASTAGLSKQIQTGLGAAGNSLPEQTAAIVKAQQQATTDLINFMQNTGVKINGGGLQ